MEKKTKGFQLGERVIVTCGQPSAEVHGEVSRVRPRTSFLDVRCDDGKTRCPALSRVRRE